MLFIINVHVCVCMCVFPPSYSFLLISFHVFNPCVSPPPTPPPLGSAGRGRVRAREVSRGHGEDAVRHAGDRHW